MRQKSAPAASWIIAVLVALPILWPRVSTVQIVEPAGLSGASPYHFEHDLERYLIPREQRDKPRGVMLAMSGGNCATRSDTVQHSEAADLYVVYYPAATLRSFDALLDVIVARQPDFVVVQDALLVHNPPSKLDLLKIEVGREYDSARAFWVGQVYGIAQHLNLSAATDPDNESWRCQLEAMPSSVWPEAVSRQMDMVEPASGQQLAEADSFLRRVAAADVPVLVVSPPTNSYSADYRDIVYATAENLVGASGLEGPISMHRQTELTPAESFLDPLHVRPSENAAYRRWLQDQILSKLGGPSH